MCRHEILFRFDSNTFSRFLVFRIFFLSHICILIRYNGVIRFIIV